MRSARYATPGASDVVHRERGPELTAYVAAQLGALTLELTYERWIDTTSDQEFRELARRTLTQVRAANPLC